LFDPQRPDIPGNRPLDNEHLKGIVRYLETETDFVIGALTLYAKKGTVRFRPVEDSSDTVELGWLSIPIDARFFIGDGQHRLKAYEQVLSTREPDDPAVENLRKSGSPAIIVEEDNPAKIAQDFVDLQRNGKPLSSSLGASMDRRVHINRLALDVVKAVKLFQDEYPGDRIHYLGQTLGKYSNQLYTFASWRYAVGTILIGFSEHSRRKWEARTNRILDGKNEYDRWYKLLCEMFEEASRQLPGWKDVLAKNMTVPQFREKYVLGSSAGLTAFAGAMHRILDPEWKQKHGLDWREALRRMAAVDWLKAPTSATGRVFFEGTIVQNGNVINNRPAFEAAAEKLYESVTSVKAA
jgi:DGQHR domain-containing protein